MSRGEFVAFLDADDAWEPTKLEKQLAVFRAKPEVGVVFCRRSLIDEQGNAIPRRGSTPPLALPRGAVLPQMFVQNFVCFSSAVVRRDVFSHVGAFDPQWDLAIDYDLWLRVAKHHRFDYVDEELVKYRTGHGNLSKKLADRVDTALSIMHRAESPRSRERSTTGTSRGGLRLNVSHDWVRDARVGTGDRGKVVSAGAAVAGGPTDVG